MQDGTVGDAINPWAVALFTSLKLAEPKTSAEEAAYGKWLDQTSDREEARRDRVHGAAGIIPNSIWLVLFFTAGIVFAFMLFFADSAERAKSQAMLIGSATAVVTATLLAIHALDNPYRPGVGSLKPVAMERSLVILDEVAGRAEHRALLSRVMRREHRCDAPRRSPRDGPPRGRRRRDRLERLPGNTLERRAGEGLGHHQQDQDRGGPRARALPGADAGRRRHVHAVGRRLRARGDASSRTSTSSASARSSGRP